MSPGIKGDAVKRANAPLIPKLTHDEFEDLKFHFGTLSWGGTRKLPYAFTELGIAMLSSVLKSKQAVRVNIQILRMFVALRQLIETHKDLARKLEALEKRYDQQLSVVVAPICGLFEPLARMKGLWA